MRGRLVLVALAIATAPPGAKAADLVVWREKGQYVEEDEALRDTIAAFEQGSGKQVELVLHEGTVLPDKIDAALAAVYRPTSPSA